MSSESESFVVQSPAADTGRAVPGVNVDAVYRILLDHLPVAIAALGGPEHVVIYANRDFHRLFGTRPEDLLGLPFATAIPDSARDDTIALLDRVFRLGQPENLLNVPRPTHGGAPAYWSYDVSPWRLEDGLEGVTLAVSDTTELVLAQKRQQEWRDQLREMNQRLLLSSIREQELAESAARLNAQFTALLATFPDAVAVVDASGHPLVLNDAARSLRGIAYAEPAAVDPAGRPDVRHLDGTMLPFDEWPFRRVLRGDLLRDDELIWISPDRGPRHLVFSGSALRRQDGKVELAIIVCRDITELRRAEQARALAVHPARHRGVAAAVRGTHQRR